MIAQTASELLTVPAQAAICPLIPKRITRRHGSCSDQEGTAEARALGGRSLGGHMYNKVLLGVAALLLTADAAFAGIPNVVPEPTSLSLLAAGIGVLAATRYFRGKK